MAYKDPKPSDLKSGIATNKGDTGKTYFPPSTSGKGDKTSGKWMKETETKPAPIKAVETKPISISKFHNPGGKMEY